MSRPRPRPTIKFRERPRLLVAAELFGGPLDGHVVTFRLSQSPHTIYCDGLYGWHVWLLEREGSGRFLYAGVLS